MNIAESFHMTYRSTYGPLQFAYDDVSRFGLEHGLHAFDEGLWHGRCGYDLLHSRAHNETGDTAT